MHRKHFILIASILKKYNTCQTTKGNKLCLQGFYELTADFANLCESENPSFDKEKFYKACGLVSFDESSM